MAWTQGVAILLLLGCQSAALLHPAENLGRRELLQKSLVAGTFGVLPVYAADIGGSIRFGDESLMSTKDHGTTMQAVQTDLLFGVSGRLADRICSFNRIFAESAGYFERTGFEDTVRQSEGPITFYDSVTGKPLFKAPIGRSVDQFIAESKTHGWPSFRDAEVLWDNVRVLRSSGETVSIDGTHLGHNLPDKLGNRYCINLVSIAGHSA
mmetsp:Transcript_15265/g.25890  ORF Transcript_15265/g.25890 Transcript_15265/m.25890 type:complete len:209 (+) Transcript_15265:47-673(+)